MGRTLKRVALDFNWPSKELWEGYINPFWKEHINCTECNGSGQNIGADILYNLAYVQKYDEIREWIKKCDNEPLNEFARSVMNKRGLRTRFFNHASYVLTKSKLKKLEPLKNKIFNSEDELVNAIAPIVENWGINFKKDLSHLLAQHSEVPLCADFSTEDFEILLKYGDIPATFFPNFIWYRFDKEQNAWMSIDRSSKDHEDWIWKLCEKPELPSIELLKEHFNSSIGNSSAVYHVTKELANKEGWKVGLCECCNGKGHVWPSKEVEEQHDNWEEYEPPVGEGFQLWNDTSGGSPISPVFKTLDALCEYAAENCNTFAYIKASQEQWKQMLQDDLVITPLLDENGKATGIVFI